MSHLKNNMSIIVFSILLLTGCNFLGETAEENTSPAVSLDSMITIPKGCFQMGSELGAFAERPVHTVCLDSFKMDVTEVTQIEYQGVMQVNPSEFNECSNCPVENVSWNNAQAYCDSVGKRLPTEAEWEYAIRGNTSSHYYWGDSLDDNYVWYSGNSDFKTRPVSTRKPNSWGLYDMSGNVYEWVSDLYFYYSSDSVYNPIGGTEAFLIHRVIRGGSWNSTESLRSTHRGFNIPTHSSNNLGFRCVLPLN
jgi:formylglycine-generating enzyme required for sulfatase activity